jgi:hypothetical protein
MGERVCLRCDWTGETDGAACPRCEASLYRLPESTKSRELTPTPRPQPQSAGDPISSSPVEVPQEDGSVLPAVLVAASRRWWLIGGGALAVAAVWIVTSVGSVDRSEKPVAPAGEVPEPAETAPTAGPHYSYPDEGALYEVIPGLAGTSPVPRPGSDVDQERCSVGAKARLELTYTGDRLNVRFEVHDSPPGHLWHIRIWLNTTIDPHRRVEMPQRAGVASDSGEFAVVSGFPSEYAFGLRAWFVKAWDSATGEVCRVNGSIH